MIINKIKMSTIITKLPFLQINLTPISQTYTIIEKIPQLSTPNLTVSKIKDNFNKKNYFLYSYQKQNNEETDSYIYQEAFYLSTLSHPNIPKIHNFYDTETTVSLVLDSVNNPETLLQTIAKTSTLTEKQTKTIIFQLLYLANYLHSKEILFRAFSLDKILYEDDSFKQLKIYNYKNIRRLKLKKTITTNYSDIEYSSPELLMKIGYSKPSDIWAIGVIMFRLLFGDFIFENIEFHLNKEEAVKTIIGKISDFNLNEIIMQKKNVKASQTAIDLLIKILNVDYNERLSAVEALNHPFFRELILNDEKIFLSNLFILNKKNLSEFMFVKKQVIVFIVNFFLDYSSFSEQVGLFRSIDKEFKGVITKEQISDRLKVSFGINSKKYLFKICNNYVENVGYSSSVGINGYGGYGKNEELFDVCSFCFATLSNNKIDLLYKGVEYFFDRFCNQSKRLNFSCLVKLFDSEINLDDSEIDVISELFEKTGVDPDVGFEKQEFIKLFNDIFNGNEGS